MTFVDLNVCITEKDRAFWCYMNPTQRPSFTVQLLADLARMQDKIGQLFASERRPFDFFVLASGIPGIFNLGGDLVFFMQKIEQGDAAALREYAHSCVRAGYANYTGYSQRVITIALIQGGALGGGFESALSCDLIVAERHCKFGFPEIMFNLFPGMGAYSFLSRRIGPVKTKELIAGGKTYPAEEMHRLGIVDLLTDPGEGRKAVENYIATHLDHHNAHSSIYQVRRRVNPVTLNELLDVADIWVKAALRLSERDLRKMRQLAAAQDRSHLRGIVSG